MKPHILIIKGAKAYLQEAYKALNGHIGVLKLTIYPFKGRYRMMVGGFISIDEADAAINDPSLKISKHQ